MFGAPNSLNLNCKVRVMKEAPGPSVSEEMGDIFRNYNIDEHEIILIALSYALSHWYENYITPLCSIWHFDDIDVLKISHPH